MSGLPAGNLQFCVRDEPPGLHSTPRTERHISRLRPFDKPGRSQVSRKLSTHSNGIDPAGKHCECGNGILHFRIDELLGLPIQLVRVRAAVERIGEVRLR